MHSGTCQTVVERNGKHSGRCLSPNRRVLSGQVLTVLPHVQLQRPRVISVLMHPGAAP